MPALLWISAADGPNCRPAPSGRLPLSTYLVRNMLYGRAGRVEPTAAWGRRGWQGVERKEKGGGATDARGRGSPAIDRGPTGEVGWGEDWRRKDQDEGEISRGSGAEELVNRGGDQYKRAWYGGGEARSGTGKAKKRKRRGGEAEEERKMTMK